MKFFGWVQNKFNGKQGSNNNSKIVLPPTYHMKEAPREDLSPDWPQKLLTIGTFGNDALINGRISNPLPDPPPEEDPSPSSIQEFTPEEVGELQKELTKLLSKKPTSQVEKELLANLPLDRFLNCPSSLEVDRRISSALGDECSENYDQEEGDNNNEDIERTITAILGRCKDICSDINNKKKGVIGKKSIAFLLKKMFVCGTGSFAPQPSLRDTLQESRIEKLLRTMLHKKIYTQNPASRTSSTKRILEDHKKTPRRQQNDEDETRDRNSSADGHKWVKTDSEYIVLEI